MSEDKKPELLERFSFITVVSRYRCTKCNGKGQFLVVDFEPGQEQYYPCIHCQGDGYKEDKKYRDKKWSKINRKKIGMLSYYK